MRSKENVEYRRFIGHLKKIGDANDIESARISINPEELVPSKQNGNIGESPDVSPQAEIYFKQENNTIRKRSKC